MSSDGSFPHKQPVADIEPEDSEETSEGGRVLEFPGEANPSEANPGEANEEPSSPGVPAGTWADDEGGDAAKSTERLLRPAGDNVVEFPRAVTQSRLRTPRRSESEPQRPEADEPRPRAEGRQQDVSGRQPSQRPKTPADAAADEEPKRPLFLASELLKQDWWPKTPLARTLRVGAIGVGLLGAVLVAVAGGVDTHALGLAGLLALCAVAGALPMGAPRRGGALALLGITGGVWVSWVSAVEAQSLFTPLLVGCVCLAASALFFRAAHQQSKLARVLVAVALVATAAWLALSGGLDALIVEELRWQAWLGPVSRLTLGVVVLAAALSFLDPAGHGGAWGAGVAFLVWLVLDAGFAVAVELAPGTRSIPALTSAPVMATVALPFFCALAAIGLLQVWVMISLSLRR